mmetsp:Transcript_6417/g.22605  ORF Transcript_6417/g.22605 Transcript_6417/m.22605 type:complete len:249 (-) Transcript_6417:2480-3226(-)
MHTRVTLAMPGMALKSALTTTFIPSARAATRMGRRARNVRSALSASRSSPLLVRPMRPTRTMRKSRTFQLLRRYAPSCNTKPYTSTFITISITKQITKTVSMLLRAFFRSLSSSRSGESMARHSEERQMSAMMKWSKRGSMTTRATAMRNGFLGPMTKSERFSSSITTVGRGLTGFTSLLEGDARLRMLETLRGADVSSPSAPLPSPWMYVLIEGLGSSVDPSSSSSSSSSPAAKLSSRMARKRLRMM